MRDGSLLSALDLAQDRDFVRCHSPSNNIDAAVGRKRYKNGYIAEGRNHRTVPTVIFNVGHGQIWEQTCLTANASIVMWSRIRHTSQRQNSLDR